jgi:oxalate decarboxylase
MFAADEFKDFSLNSWLRHLPTELVIAHLNLDTSTIKRNPSEKSEVV